jgi:hypothetical protein
MDTPAINLDAKLRRHGFRIFSRIRECRPLWERNGKLYTVTVALTVIRREMKELEVRK